MNRRGFVFSVGGGLVAFGPGGLCVQGAVHVEATPTLFHGHPDGATTLVRFDASGVDAPAGRLRVHDLRSGRSLGTAGMIRRGERLTGELWLPLTVPIRVRSELETPARRGVIRTVHRLAPTSRWTIYWITLAAPDRLLGLYADIPPLLRGAEAGRLVPAGIRVNPWHNLPPDGDHLDLVRITIPAATTSRVTGVPLARVALVDGEVGPHVARALDGAGVTVRLRRRDVVDPTAFDLATGRAQAAPRIEAWLRSREEGDAEPRPIAVTIGTEPAFAATATAGIDDWNGAFAYPRIVLGDGDEAVRVLGGVGEVGEQAAAAGAAEAAGGTAGIETAEATGEAGIGTPTTGRDDAFAVLARVVAPAEPTLEGIAQHFAFPIGGTLVFNPSPFGRSDVVTMEDGGLRVVTDVPGMGYAFVPDAAPAEIVPGDDPVRVEAETFAVAIERSGGALAALVHRPTGRDLVHADDLLDGLRDGVLSGVQAERIAGLGSRLIVRRATAQHVVRSTITVYDGLPWLDIATEVVEGPAGAIVERRFAFAHATEHATWEVPGGTADAAVPLPPIHPLRWTALHGDDTALLFGTAHRAAIGVERDGTLTVRTALATQFRISLHTGHLLPDDPWRFGFGMLPLVPVRVSGRGTFGLPSFGRLLDIADPAVAVLAVRPAEDGTGVMVFLQDVGGPSRDILLRPDVLTFDTGILTDLAERDVREASSAPGGGLVVPIAASGWAAVRLLGVRLGGEAV